MMNIHELVNGIRVIHQPTRQFWTVEAFHSTSEVICVSSDGQRSILKLSELERDPGFSTTCGKLKLVF